MVKKMRTFLEVENKMGPIIPALANQYRQPLPETNPSVRKGNATEKRKTVTLKRKFRPVAPKLTVTHSPIPNTPPKPTSNAAATSTPMMVRQDTPWPSTGTMSANLFQDRNWLLPKDYLATQRKSVVGAWMPSMPGTEERGRFSPSKEPMENQQQQKPLPKLHVIRPDTLNMTKTKQQWEQEMERLNEKYKLDTFSDSELDSKSDKDE